MIFGKCFRPYYVDQEDMFEALSSKMFCRDSCFCKDALTIETELELTTEKVKNWYDDYHHQLHQERFGTS